MIKKDPRCLKSVPDPVSRGQPDTILELWDDDDSGGDDDDADGGAANNEGCDIIEDAANS